MRLVYPDGTVIGAADATFTDPGSVRPDPLARRIGRHGLIGFGESYMAGEWESTDLDRGADRPGAVDDRPRAARAALAATARARRFQPRWRDASRDQTRRNIAEHYDLSNDLFIEFLDETMTYSSALFDRLPATWPDLAQAQRRKIDRLLDRPASDPAPGCWRSAPDGANCVSARPPAAPSSAP